MHSRLSTKLALAAALTLSFGPTRLFAAEPCMAPVQPGMAMPPAMPLVAPHAIMVKLMDENGDGGISKGEAMAFHKVAFNQRDRNGDGKISREEAMEPMLAPPGRKTPEFE